MEIISRSRPEVYKMWIDALRSGKYHQAEGQLKVTGGWYSKANNKFDTGDLHCCLGVLCDLAAKDGGVQWLGESYDDENSFLPFKIADWMGLSHKDQEYLSGMNDDQQSFDLIADHIEQHFLVRFTE